MTYWALVNFRYFKLHFASFVLIESYDILHLLHLIFAIFGAAGARRVMVQSEPRIDLRYSDARLKDVQLVLAPFTLRLFGAAGAHIVKTKAFPCDGSSILPRSSVLLLIV